MANSTFPELDGWDEIINRNLTNKDTVSLLKATQKLVLSLTNFRSVVSSQAKYLKNEIGYLKDSVDLLNNSFVSLNENIKKADKSSTKLSTALNRLTLGGVIIAGLGILLAVIQFLFENKIWPFLS